MLLLKDELVKTTAFGQRVVEKYKLNKQKYAILKDALRSKIEDNDQLQSEIKRLRTLGSTAPQPRPRISQDDVQSALHDTLDSIPEASSPLARAGGTAAARASAFYQAALSPEPDYAPIPEAAGSPDARPGSAPSLNQSNQSNQSNQPNRWDGRVVGPLTSGLSRRRLTLRASTDSMPDVQLMEAAAPWRRTDSAVHGEQFANYRERKTVTEEDVGVLPAPATESATAAASASAAWRAAASAASAQRHQQHTEAPEMTGPPDFCSEVRRVMDMLPKLPKLPADVEALNAPHAATVDAAAVAPTPAAAAGTQSSHRDAADVAQADAGQSGGAELSPSRRRRRAKKVHAAAAVAAAAALSESLAVADDSAAAPAADPAAAAPPATCGVATASQGGDGGEYLGCAGGEGAAQGAAPHVITTDEVVAEIRTVTAAAAGTEAATVETAASGRPDAVPWQTLGVDGDLDLPQPTLSTWQSDASEQAAGGICTRAAYGADKQHVGLLSGIKDADAPAHISATHTAVAAEPEASSTYSPGATAQWQQAVTAAPTDVPNAVHAEPDRQPLHAAAVLQSTAAPAEEDFAQSAAEMPATSPAATLPTSNDASGQHQSSPDDITTAAGAAGAAAGTAEPSVASAPVGHLRTTLFDAHEQRHSLEASSASGSAWQQQQGPHRQGSSLTDGELQEQRETADADEPTLPVPALVFKAMQRAQRKATESLFVRSPLRCHTQHHASHTNPSPASPSVTHASCAADVDIGAPCTADSGHQAAADSGRQERADSGHRAAAGSRYQATADGSGGRHSMAAIEAVAHTAKQEESDTATGAEVAALRPPAAASPPPSVPLQDGDEDAAASDTGGGEAAPADGSAPPLSAGEAVAATAPAVVITQGVEATLSVSTIDGLTDVSVTTSEGDTADDREDDNEAEGDDSAGEDAAAADDGDHDAVQHVGSDEEATADVPVSLAGVGPAAGAAQPEAAAWVHAVAAARGEDDRAHSADVAVDHAASSPAAQLPAGGDADVQESAAGEDEQHSPPVQQSASDRLQLLSGSRGPTVACNVVFGSAAAFACSGGTHIPNGGSSTAAVADDATAEASYAEFATTALPPTGKGGSGIRHRAVNRRTLRTPTATTDDIQVQHHPSVASIDAPIAAESPLGHRPLADIAAAFGSGQQLVLSKQASVTSACSSGPGSGYLSARSEDGSVSASEGGAWH